MGSLDLLVVAVYLSITVLAGMYWGRGGSDSAYLVAGRSLTWPTLLLSIVSTETSTVTFLSLPGKSFQEGGNFTFAQLAIGYILGRYLVARWLLPEYFKGELFTAHEVLERRFGPRVRRAASLLFLVFRNLADGIRWILPALVVHQTTGLPFEASVIVLAGATALYAAVGGVSSVIWNDSRSSWFTCWARCSPYGSWRIGCRVDSRTFLLLPAARGATEWFDPALGLTGSTITIWSGVIGGATLSFASHGVDHLMVQRYLCAVMSAKRPGR